MSIAALCLNGFLATLLMAALFLGLRLDRKLKGVRDGQQAFVLAVHELNAAAAKAQAALANLRAATDEATDTLGGRITRARECADRLDKLVTRAEARQMSAPAPAAARDEPDAEPKGGLAALLARLEDEMDAPGPERAPSASFAPAASSLLARTLSRPARPVRPSFDDDLFVDSGDRA